MHENSIELGDSAAEKAVAQCFLDQLRSYPDMQIQDIYKFVFQGVMGSGHAIQSESIAFERFQAELSNLCQPDSPEEVVEFLSTKIIRVNLRPYVRNGGDTSSLFKAFVRTGYTHGGSEKELGPVWEVIKPLQTKFNHDDMDIYFSLQRKSGFPAVHHSGIYRELYTPSYRVISVKELSWSRE